MMKRHQIYEGKAKVLFAGTEAGTLVQYFKDDATAFNNQKHDVIDGKGVLNCRISEYLFSRLGEIGIPTHYIETLNMREQLVHEVEIVPLEVVVRNIAAGSLVKRLGLTQGARLARPLVEYYYKDDALGDPLVSENHIEAFDWASSAELADMSSYALRINEFMSELFQDIGIELVDFKLEFGRHKTDTDMRIILADEISPDSCRLWDIETGKKMDKDRFREDLGGLTEAYHEVAQRLGLVT